MGEKTTIAGLDGQGEIPGYISRPATTPTAAIIVVPEIFGVNAGIRAKVDDWAALGYLAFAPDIFWRFAPGVELNPDVPEQLQQAFGYFQQYDIDLGIDDIKASIIALKAEPGIAKVGLVGFCLGGRIAYLSATRTSVDAAVGYYGVYIDQAVSEAGSDTSPLVLHIPTADHFVGPEAQAAIHAGLAHLSQVTLYDYAGLDHGFAATEGNRRDEAGAQLADGRTQAFFSEILQ